jgi:hypothetical protein
MSAEVKGAATLSDTLGQAAAALLDLGPTSQAAADDVLGYVLPPVRTGKLAATVRAESGPLGFVLTAGGPSAPYAPYAHKRDPFLTKALDDRRTAVIDQYADHVQDAVDLIQGA